MSFTQEELRKYIIENFMGSHVKVSVPIKDESLLEESVKTNASASISPKLLDSIPVPSIEDQETDYHEENEGPVTYEYLHDNPLATDFSYERDYDKLYKLSLCIYKINTNLNLPFLEFFFIKKDGSYQFPETDLQIGSFESILNSTPVATMHSIDNDDAHPPDIDDEDDVNEKINEEFRNQCLLLFKKVMGDSNDIKYNFQGFIETETGIIYAVLDCTEMEHGALDTYMSAKENSRELMQPTASQHGGNLNVQDDHIIEEQPNSLAEEENEQQQEQIPPVLEQQQQQEQIPPALEQQQQEQEQIHPALEQQQQEQEQIPSVEDEEPPIDEDEQQKIPIIDEDEAEDPPQEREQEQIQPVNEENPQNKPLPIIEEAAAAALVPLVAANPQLPSTEESMWGIIDEIITKQRILDTPIHDNIYQLFDENPQLLFMKNLTTSKFAFPFGELPKFDRKPLALYDFGAANPPVSVPIVVYLCKDEKTNVYYKENQSSNTSQSIINPKVAHPVFDNIFLFSRQPLSIENLNQIKRFALFIDNALYFHNKTFPITDVIEALDNPNGDTLDKEHVSFTDTDEYNDFSCFSFYNGEQEMWAVKNVWSFTEL